MSGRRGFDSVVERIDSPKGLADFYSLRKLETQGHDISELPYSIRVLLENAVRNAGTVAEAEDAARRMIEWPRSVGSGFPFMPYRVLLQDYTGVPLIVDLAAMRDAMKRAGGDPRSINSSVPMDLIIDHSVQVDGWGDVLAFSLNIEKEYERNSERYSLLKWAQSSFRNLRVFPPGKGICHQVNLEYLSSVVALKEQGGRRLAVPDTLVGTDSHTTMVNGLGVLGWGVGGIEAEAVMLGEPYHMPIPRVVGVKIVGELREGATPTDVVLTVTELLRSRNVVDAFVEYFGEGYQHLSVPDRATLGNMSPEYGATAGFSPVDASTLRYLIDTGRDPEHVKFVENYCRSQGLFASLDTPEPSYSEVVVLDLAEIEPSIAGPRNPEERRLLTAVPAFANSLIEEKRKGRSVAVTPASSGSQAGQLLVRGGFGHDPSGLNDGSVIIAAITSCTNTSNPTVMIGAGLIAKKAVEKGLSPKPFVKASLAPGSTVVKDYLEGSGLLSYLDKLGFNLVGYGCTTCIAEGTPVLLADGTSRSIESLPSSGALVLGPSVDGKLGMAKQSALMNQGVRECVELVLQDGRTLICTPDHKILCNDGNWIRAGELQLGKDRVVVGPEVPLDTPGGDEAGYVLRAGDFIFSMETDLDRSKALAFARLIGYLLGDGSISVYGQGRIGVGQAVDREMVLNDVELLTGLRPAASRYDERKWSAVLPMALTRAIAAIPGVQVGRRVIQPPTLPEFVCRDDCPTAVVREFLGGLFGADGHSPMLHQWGSREEDSTLEPPAFSQSTIPEHLERSREMVLTIVRLLGRCGVNIAGAHVYDYPTRRSERSYPFAKDGIPRVEVRLDLPDGLSFVEHVGFRYCVDKLLRANAAATYWRMVDGIHKQRQWMSAHLQELHQDEPTLSFSRARESMAVSLLGHEAEHSLPPVVSHHYALLEGYDRFSRLPLATDREFRPLHRDSCNFPSPGALLTELGVGAWFGAQVEPESGSARQYSVEKESLRLPTFSLQVIDRRPVGQKRVYDISVESLHAFVAGTVAVHNCIGNSGPLDPKIESAVKERDLYAVAVLSGNRNFDGRIHPQAKGSFLMSPMLVVAYALAGNIAFDFSQPLGNDASGRPVYLKDLWPSMAEIKEVASRSLSSELYRKRYADALVGDESWNSLPGESGDTFQWDDSSTYVREPSWFDGEKRYSSRADISGARVLAVYEDKITTDHISPAGSIAVDSPAGKYLLEHGVEMLKFSTYGARRGNHEVMVRGGFANIRLRNLLADGKEGWYTKYLPTGEITSIYEASMRYGKTPLIILAGKQYGSGSSRDWAAKAPKLLGVRAVIAENFERIHRSNLVAMGVLPLEFTDGQNAKSLGLRGDEEFTISGLKDLKPGVLLDVAAKSTRGEVDFRVKCRIDNKTEIDYYDDGGVLPYVFGHVRSEK